MENLFSVLTEQIRQVIDKELEESLEIERIFGKTNKIVEKALNSWILIHTRMTVPDGCLRHVPSHSVVPEQDVIVDVVS